MRRIFLIAAAVTALATSAWAETVHVGVNGLVCAFCVAGIEKSFKKDESVESVKVDLDSKLVTIHTRPAQSLDDKTITRLITDAGYTVTRIHREK